MRWLYESGVTDECLLEIDADYDDLARSLKLEYVAEKAAEFYRGRTRLDGTPVFLHAKRVALASRRLACHVYDEDLVGAKHYWPKVCEAAGYLHEAPLLAHLTFEALVDVADEAVARAVCSCTPDWRHPRPRRNETLAANLGVADLSARLVKLVDLRDTAEFLHGCLSRNQPGIKDSCTDFCYEVKELLPLYRTRPEGLPSLCELFELLSRVCSSLETLFNQLEKFCFEGGHTPQRRERHALCG